MESTKKDKICYGITSKAKDNKHIFMIDFDYDDYKRFSEILLDIQKKFKLSTFFIFKTKHGYHGFTLDKLHLNEIVSILCQYEEIQDLYIALAIKRGFFVLRWGNDKKYLGYIYNPSTSYIKSFSHHIFLKEVLNIDIPYFICTYDNNIQFETIAYRSYKHGWDSDKLLNKQVIE